MTIPMAVNMHMTGRLKPSNKIFNSKEGLVGNNGLTALGTLGIKTSFHFPSSSNLGEPNWMQRLLAEAFTRYSYSLFC